MRNPKKLKNNEVDSNPKNTKKKANLKIPKIRIEGNSTRHQDPKNNETKKTDLATPEGTKSTTQEGPKTHGSLFQIFSICGGCAEFDSQEQEQEQ